MSGAVKQTTWHGRTDSHAFEVEYFEDEEPGVFIARINAHTPALAPALQPGQAAATMGFEEEVKLRNTDQDVLRALARKHVEERFGEILQEREQAA